MAALGSLVIELQANQAKLQSDMGRVNHIIETAMNRVERQAARASGSIANMARTAAASRQGAQGIAKIREETEKLHHTTVGARREMLVIAHELATGQFSRAGGSLMVLGERMDFMGRSAKYMNAVFGAMGVAVGAGAKAMAADAAAKEAAGVAALKAAKGFKVTESSMARLTASIAAANPATYGFLGGMSAVAGGAIAAAAAIVGIVIPIGLATAAFIKGKEEAKAFASALALTGSYSGQTLSSFRSTAESLAAANHESISSSRELTQALISTGRFGSESYKSVAAAASTYAALSKQDTEKVIGHFENMSEGVLKWALSMDKQVHFMNGALYDHIKTLEETGQKEQAMVVAADAMNAAMRNAGAAVLAQEGAFHSLGNWISNIATKFKDAISGTNQLADSISSLKSDLAALPKDGGWMNRGVQMQRQYLERKLGSYTSTQRRQQDNAELIASKKANDEKVVAAKEYWSKVTEAHKEGASAMNREIDKARRQGALAGAPQKDIDAEVARIRKAYDHSTKGGGGGNVMHAQMESELKALQDQETAVLHALERQEKLMDRQYKDNKLSMSTYYGGEEALIRKATKDISAAYDAQIAVEERYASRAKTAAERINATTKAKSLRDQKSDKLADLEEKLTLLRERREQDEEAYAQGKDKIGAGLADMFGDKGTGAGEKFDRENRAFTKRATAENDVDQIKQIASLREATIAQAKINGLKAEAAEIDRILANTERLVQVEVSTGQRTQIQGWQAVTKARQEAATKISAITAQERAIADQSGVPTLIAQADEASVKLAELTASSDVLGKSLNDVFVGSLSKGMEELILGTKTVKSVFLDMANSILQAMSQIIAKDLASRLFGSIGGSGEGGGGLIGALLKLIPGGEGGGGLLSMAFGGGRASGGPVGAGMFYEVNERGPELLTMANRTYLMTGDQPGRVTPVSGSGTASGSQHFWNMNITVPPGTTRATAQQQASAIMVQAQTAMARNR